MSIYQDNLDEPYLNFIDDLDIEIACNPLLFYHNYESMSYYDNGKKILAPKFLLYKLSKYDNIEYPIHIRINNTIFTVHDFCEDIDCIYIPTYRFYDICLQENQITPITILKTIPPKATMLQIKPMTEEIYSIPDIKKYLEIHFTKLYASVHKFELLRIPYQRSFIEFSVTDCKPENIVSLNEIEELTLDLQPLVEKEDILTAEDLNDNSEEFDFSSDENDNNNNTNNVNNHNNDNIDNNDSVSIVNNNKPKVFVPFSGKSNKLSDK